MNSINQIINFDLHPIHLSEKYISNCKSQLVENSILQLDKFLLPNALKKIHIWKK